MKDNTKEGVFRSVCRLCHGGCGVVVHVKDGRVVGVKGDPESPMSKGWMCVKGIKSPEFANHPERLKVPLKREGKRGGGKWLEITWDTALGEITERIDAIRKDSGPEAIAIGQGTGRHHYMHVVRFANMLGTPNWYEPGLAQCFIPRITVSNLTYGGFVVADYYGAIRPKCILFWGHNPLVTGPDGELSISVKRALDSGAKGIAVDPRRTETAKRCSLWLPVRPGTDSALALAMMNVIIGEGLYDRGFVDKWCHGFNELKDHVRGFTPEWAQAITTVKKEAIIDAARMYATERPSVLEWGLGIEQNPNSLQTVRAIAILRAITGNIDVPGGDILGMNVIKSYPTLREMLSSEAQKKRLGSQEFKLLGGFRAFMPSAHIPALFRAMREGLPYRVRALLLFGNNPLLTVANSMEVYEGLKALDLLVATDLFMTPSASLADYVLPAAFWTETEGVIGYPLVVENIVYAQEKITQTGSCRQDEWIMDELARRLGLPGSQETFRDVMDMQLGPLGLTFEGLKKRHFVYPQHEYRRFERQGFRTPSRKVELYSRSLERLGYGPLPTFREPPESPASRPEVSAEFPYVLITGARTPEFFHSEGRQIESLRRLRPDPSCSMHPRVAERHGIRDRDWVRLSSPRGSIRMRANVTEDIHPDVVSAEHGWWFPEKKADFYGVFESNANVLTNSNPPYDPAFGSYQLRGVLCRVDKEG
jgi:anaerobic selenocysteine-containing dehydrogenase